MKLILLTGYPGVGKHRIAKELSERTSYGFFYTHAFLQSICRVFDCERKSYYEFFQHALEEVVTRALEEKLPGLIVTFGMDPKMSDEYFESLFRLVEASNGNVSIVELWCDKEEHRLRIQGQGRQAQGKFTAPDMTDDVRGEVSQRNFGRNVYRVDTSALSPTEVASQIIENI